MRRKLVAMLTAATLVVGMLAGCGGGSDSKDAKEPATSDSADKGEGSGSGTAASEGITTEVGTPRSETLIVECQNKTDTPGQFNSYMQGTAMGFGIHQMMKC